MPVVTIVGAGVIGVSWARLFGEAGNHGDYLGELAAAAGDSGPLERTLPFLAAFLD